MVDRSGRPKRMETRPRPIQVRPRKGSQLERVQRERNNDMADVIHSWAETFASMKKQSEEKE